MSSIPPLSSQAHKFAGTGAAHPRAVEKPCDASAFHGEQNAETRADEKIHGESAAEALRQSGTGLTVPNGHDGSEAIALTSPFVAQLLGQIMENRHLPLPQARAAYGKGSGRSALLIDARF